MKSLPELIRLHANRAARNVGRNKATYVAVNLKSGAPAVCVENRPFHWETKSGVCVRHPMAYLRKARSARLIYVPTVCDVEVNPRLIALRERVELIA